jgi:hypothetical protein
MVQRWQTVDFSKPLPAFPATVVDLDVNGGSAKSITVAGAQGIVRISSQPYGGLLVEVPAPPPTVNKVAVRALIAGISINELFDTYAEADARRGQLQAELGYGHDFELKDVEVPVEG